MSQAQLETMGEDERRLLGYYDSADPYREGSVNSNSLRNSMAVVPYSISNKTMRNQKAQAQIEKIKRNKIEREEQKRLEDERLKMRSERKNKKLREALNKRKIELGIAPAG